MRLPLPSWTLCVPLESTRSHRPVNVWPNAKSRAEFEGVFVSRTAQTNGLITRPEHDTRLPNWLLGCLIVAGLFTTLWLWNRYSNARDAASKSHRDVRQVSQWQQDIQRARNRPRIASASRETPDTVSRQVTEALTQAGVDSRKLLAIDPQPAVRIPRSDYQESLTLIRLRNLTLEEILDLCGRLASSQNGLTVRDLSLTPGQIGAVQATSAAAPARSASVGDNPERWDIRMTLTQLVFSPISRS